MNQMPFTAVHQDAHRTPVAWCPYCPTFWETALEAARDALNSRQTHSAWNLPNADSGATGSQHASQIGCSTSSPLARCWPRPGPMGVGAGAHCRTQYRQACAKTVETLEQFTDRKSVV